MITEGKWVYDSLDDGGHVIKERDHIGRYLARTYQTKSDSSLANARAISCLPDMIEALQAIVAALDGYLGKDLIAQEGFPMDKARRALQKAGITAIDGV